jgi:SOS response regulatory protein OraA/RecX
VDQIYLYALKLLKARDYTVAKLSEKLREKFGEVPPEVIQQLLQKNFLSDRRFTENYVGRKKDRGPSQLREELTARGVPGQLIEEILSGIEWPSLHDTLKAKMDGWRLQPPLQPRDAARLFRALARLGYDEDAIREEINYLRERSKRKPDRAQP